MLLVNSKDRLATRRNLYLVHFVDFTHHAIPIKDLGTFELWRKANYFPRGCDYVTACKKWGLNYTVSKTKLTCDVSQLGI